jgi:hypothetical protein
VQRWADRHTARWARCSTLIVTFLASARLQPTADPEVVNIEVRDRSHPEYGVITLIFLRKASAPGGPRTVSWVALDSQNKRTTIRLSNHQYGIDVRTTRSSGTTRADRLVDKIPRVAAHRAADATNRYTFPGPVHLAESTNALHRDMSRRPEAGFPLLPAPPGRLALAKRDERSKEPSSLLPPGRGFFFLLRMLGRRSTTRYSPRRKSVGGLENLRRDT